MGVYIHCVIPASFAKVMAKSMMEGNMTHTLCPTLGRIRGVELLVTKGASVGSRWFCNAEVSETVRDPLFTVGECL